MSKTIEEVVSEIILEDRVDKIVGDSIEIIIIGIVVIAETGTGLEKHHFQEVMVVIELEVQTIVDQGQDPEPVPIEIG